MGLADACFADDDDALLRQALATTDPKMATVTYDALMANGWVRLNVPTPHLPYADGGFLTPSGKCEFHSARMAAMGLDPLPAFTPPHEFPEMAPELAARFPLALVSSPRHQFLNSTFVNVSSLRRDAEPEVTLHPDDAAPRGIVEGAPVTVFNDRGAFSAIARVAESVRVGVAWAPSVWWGKLTNDGHNANETTSQRTTDMGGGPVYYDNLVEIAPAE